MIFVTLSIGTDDCVIQTALQYPVIRERAFNDDIAASRRSKQPNEWCKSAE